MTPMQETENETRIAPSSSTNTAIRAIVHRMAGREDELVRHIAARYREEIVDYRVADEAVSTDAGGVARDNLDALLFNLGREGAKAQQHFEKTRAAAARRVHQGVSLESFLHAFRLWGESVWDALRSVAGDSPLELEALVEVAGEVMRHVDIVSTVGAHAYLLEAQGLSHNAKVLPRDLLEALLGARHDPDWAVRRARSFGVRLAENYVALSMRPQEVPVGKTDAASIIAMAHSSLQPAGGGLLVGVRYADVVALYPLPDPAQLQMARKDAAALAAAVAGRGVVVGMSGWQPGLAGIALAYAEAKEAGQIAAIGGIIGRPVSLDEVLIDHIARFTPHVSRILDETLHPLVDYDIEHQTSLIPTVRAYVDAGFNLTKSAEILHVHPNTVMYRLRRVKELCGRDPHDPDDLLILFLAMRLAELSPLT